jgi:molybdopterin-binding protein
MRREFLSGRCGSRGKLAGVVRCKINSLVTICTPAGTQLSRRRIDPSAAQLGIAQGSCHAFTFVICWEIGLFAAGCTFYLKSITSGLQINFENKNFFNSIAC